MAYPYKIVLQKFILQGLFVVSMLHMPTKGGGFEVFAALGKFVVLVIFQTQVAFHAIRSVFQPRPGFLPVRIKCSFFFLPFSKIYVQNTK